MNNRDKSDIKNLKEIVLFIKTNLSNTKKIILFGSVAKKNQGNDIDLAIVTTPWNGDLRELYQEVGKKLKAICQKFPIDYFIIPVNIVDIFKDSLFLRSINNTGRLLYMDNDSINEWINDAKLDYEQSCYLFQGGYYKGTCYFAQQSIEKFLKSKLLFLGWELKKVHQIVFLVSELISYGYTVTSVDDDNMSFIDSIYKSRYPGEQGLLPYGDPSRDDARKAIGIAHSIGIEMGHELSELKTFKTRPNMDY